MKLLLTVLMALGLTSCATMGERTIADAAIGDFYSLDVADSEGCAVEILTITAAKPSPFGIVRVRPEVCGVVKCEKSTEQGLVDGTALCFYYDALGDKQ